MKQLCRLFFAFLCICVLTLGVLAAGPRVDTMDVSLVVDENGTARADASLHVVLDDPQESFSINLGPNVSGVHVDGYKVKTSHTNAQRIVTIFGQPQLPAVMDLHLTYTIRNTVQSTSDTQSFTIRPLGGLASAEIRQFSLRIQMPGAFDAIPEFSSGYYADGIDNYLTIKVTADGLLTATSTATLLAGETLDLRLETTPDYFALRNVAGRTLLFDRIAMIVLAFLALIYWWNALRSPFPRLSRQTRPPMGVEPGTVGMLILGESPDLALMVFHWALNGYLRINRLPGGKLLLTCLIPMGNERNPYEQSAFAQLFVKQPEVLANSRAWVAAQKTLNKSARTYWNGRLYHQKPGHPKLLRAFAVLFCAFAALFYGDHMIPSMSLRPLILAAIILCGVIWGIALQYALSHLLMRRRRTPILCLAICILLPIIIWRITLGGGVLFVALLVSVLTAFLLLFGPKRTQNGTDLLSDLLGWRRYLRSLTPTDANQLVQNDPQSFYKLLLYAEALGLGKRFCRTFHSIRLDPCDFFVRNDKAMPRQPTKFREHFLSALAHARGEYTPPKKRPQPVRTKPSAGHNRPQRQRVP